MQVPAFSAASRNMYFMVNSASDPPVPSADPDRGQREAFMRSSVLRRQTTNVVDVLLVWCASC